MSGLAPACDGASSQKLLFFVGPIVAGILLDVARHYIRQKRAEPFPARESVETPTPTPAAEPSCTPFPIQSRELTIASVPSQPWEFIEPPIRVRAIEREPSPFGDNRAFYIGPSGRHEWHGDFELRLNKCSTVVRRQKMQG